MADGKNRYEQGMRKRKAVLGETYVEAAVSRTDDFNRAFQGMITETAWGNVWTGDHWDDRQRSIVTIALLAALGHHDELALHVRATQNTGASKQDIAEALMHVAVYAGVPAANTGFKIAATALAESETESS